MAGMEDDLTTMIIYSIYDHDEWELIKFAYETLDMPFKYILETIDG